MERETVGDLLREWRERRRMSQMSLALEAEVSTRHVSFIESGRAQGSRDMLLHLAEQLPMPLRSRNRLLLAGGFAPAYTQTALDSEQLQDVQIAIDAVLDGHLPYPALVIDRQWNLVKANAAVFPLLAGAAPELLVPPVNILRLSLHPDGLATRIVNIGEWRHHLLERLNRQVESTGDPQLKRLLQSLVDMPVAEEGKQSVRMSSIAVPMLLRSNQGRVLNLIATTTVFGTALDVTLSELAIECFLPADSMTREYFLKSNTGNAARLPTVPENSEVS